MPAEPHVPHGLCILRQRCRHCYPGYAEAEPGPTSRNCTQHVLVICLIQQNSKHPSATEPCAGRAPCSSQGFKFQYSEGCSSLVSICINVCVQHQKWKELNGPEMVLFLRDSEGVPWKRLVYKEEFMGKGMNLGSLESTYAHDCIWNRSPTRTYWAAQGALLNTL